uniref:Uncharacterized protein n=1 Tax=Anguilla anguilla TaxID=7936 RepID=A0A0E9XDH3_ANGAN
MVDTAGSSSLMGKEVKCFPGVLNLFIFLKITDLA